MMSERSKILARAFSISQHNQSHATSFLIRLALNIRSPRNRQSPIVEQVIVQPTIPRTELEIFQEDAIIEEGQRIKHIKFEFVSEDQGVLNKRRDTFLIGRFGCVRGGRCIMEEVRCPDDVVLGFIEDGGGEGVKGEAVGDFLSRRILSLDAKMWDHGT